MKTGRRERAPTPSEQATLCRLWPDDAITQKELARRLKVIPRVMNRWAAALGLPERKVNRALIIAGARRGGLVMHQQDEARAVAQVARCERMLAQEEPTLIPQRIRCDCGGIVDLTEGGVVHRCFVRRAAA